MDTHGWLTLHDVARADGLELTNGEAWVIGRRLQRLWLWKAGCKPEKDLRAKKGGAGSHCFALYPPTDEWVERIRRQIRTVRPPQGNLFG